MPRGERDRVTEGPHSARHGSPVGISVADVVRPVCAQQPLVAPRVARTPAKGERQD
jgi:hypothetical protein